MTPDAVAAIAGAMLGAAYGASAVSGVRREMQHGWSGLRNDDLVRLAVGTGEGEVADRAVTIVLD